MTLRKEEPNETKGYPTKSRQHTMAHAREENKENQAPNKDEEEGGGSV